MTIPTKALRRLRQQAQALIFTSTNSASSSNKNKSNHPSSQQQHSRNLASMSPSSSSSSQQPTSSTHKSAAPWRNQFLEHTGIMDSPEFMLATISHAPVGNNFGHTLEPRVRTCVFRGFWGSLPPNKHNDTPKNPGEIESDCLTFTTDVRMEKCKDFFLDLKSEGDEKASGGGAPVEAVWWINEDKVKTQWRVRGDVWVLGPDFKDSSSSSNSNSAEQQDGPERVKSAIESRMRASGSAKVEDFDWNKEITAHFGNLSPGMRGSFKNPPPGKPVEATRDPNDMLIGQLIDDLEDAKARENFRVVIIRPFRVESTDLIEPREARRQEYIFDEVTSEWKHQTLWP